jgi:nucleoside-diphosphate-sugar epimerase
VASRYLITGGAGFLGINLCRHLLAHGERVRSLDIAPFDYPERQQVAVIQGDIRDPLIVDAAMSDVDVVVHAAAARPLAPREDILSTAVRGTRATFAASCASYSTCNTTKGLSVAPDIGPSPVCCGCGEAKTERGDGTYGKDLTRVE